MQRRRQRREVARQRRQPSIDAGAHRAEEIGGDRVDSDDRGHALTAGAGRAMVGRIPLRGLSRYSQRPESEPLERHRDDDGRQPTAARRSCVATRPIRRRVAGDIQPDLSASLKGRGAMKSKPGDLEHRGGRPLRRRRQRRTASTATRQIGSATGVVLLDRRGCVRLRAFGAADDLTVGVDRSPAGGAFEPLPRPAPVACRPSRCSSAAPEQADGARLDRLAAADRPHLLGRLRLDADLVDARRRARRRCAGASPRCAARASAPAAITVASTLPTCQPATLDRRAAFGEQRERVGAAVLRVGVGEVMADVAERGGAEQGIGDRVAERVGVGVAEQAVRVRDLDAAEDELPAGDEGVRVPAFADAPERAASVSCRAARAGAAAAPRRWRSRRDA